MINITTSILVVDTQLNSHKSYLVNKDTPTTGDNQCKNNYRVIVKWLTPFEDLNPNDLQTP
ncbi:hypothetical protein IEQ34_001567 [Dendrobium chrysotoxum]|uniref:Uncharacterized protein n=1 Tax=Dendrobium chrysotoxum TaxID=161865 RepID=A0AAV7H8A8_DENCH|nr:hypothetical protein IEQ34_001567 [Dendrobium chrysotoxum]